MQLAGVLMVDRTAGIKTFERLADVNRCQRFPGLIELALDLDQRLDKDGPFVGGQSGEVVGHAVSLSRHRNSLPNGS